MQQQQLALQQQEQRVVRQQVGSSGSSGSSKCAHQATVAAAVQVYAAGCEPRSLAASSESSSRSVGGGYGDSVAADDDDVANADAATTTDAAAAANSAASTSCLAPAPTPATAALPTAAPGAAALAPGCRWGHEVLSICTHLPALAPLQPLLDRLGLGAVTLVTTPGTTTSWGLAGYAQALPRELLAACRVLVVADRAGAEALPPHTFEVRRDAGWCLLHEDGGRLPQPAAGVAVLLAADYGRDPCDHSPK